MALKKSRPITVEGKAYRWKLAGRSRLIGNAPEAAHLVIQEATERPGRPLCIWLVSKNWGPAQEEVDWPHHASVTPADVAAVINLARTAGWEPSAKTPFKGRLDIELTDYRGSTNRKSR